jgi:hypothetical protein
MTAQAFEPLEIRVHSVSRPVAYRFVFQGFGWAIFTLNDDTGEFTMTSDWGDYAHRWHVGRQGAKDGTHVTLTEFLAWQTSGEYVVTKFSYNHPKELEDEFDPEKTKRSVADHLRTVNKDLRDEGKPTIREEIRDIDYDDERSFVDSIERDDVLRRHLSAPWEFIHRKRSGRYEILSKHLLPWFFGWLRENVAKVQP